MPIVLVTERHIEERPGPVRLVVWPLARDAASLRDELGSNGVQPHSVAFVGYEGDIMRRRAAVVLELSRADVANFRFG